MRSRQEQHQSTQRLQNLCSALQSAQTRLAFAAGRSVAGTSCTCHFDKLFCVPKSRHESVAVVILQSRAAGKSAGPCVQPELMACTCRSAPLLHCETLAADTRSVREYAPPYIGLALPKLCSTARDIHMRHDAVLKPILPHANLRQNREPTPSAACCSAAGIHAVGLGCPCTHRRQKGLNCRPSCRHWSCR